jgi:hypothetical protein
MIGFFFTGQWILMFARKIRFKTILRVCLESILKSLINIFFTLQSWFKNWRAMPPGSRLRGKGHDSELLLEGSLFFG